MNKSTYAKGIIWVLPLLTLFHSMVADEQYPADENVFLKQAINFSPKAEKHLDDQWLVPPKTPYAFPKSRVERVSGVLRMTCDGKPLNMFCRDVWSTTLKGAPLERQLRENGIKFFQINTDIHAPLDKDPHHAFNLFKRRAANLLKSVPDAKFMIRIWMMNVSEDFEKKYPNALLTGPTGETKWKGRYYTKIKSRPNALNEWRRYCGEALYRFIHDVGKSKYAKHVVGFYVGALNSGEWWYYKGKGDPGWDYSTTRKAAFKHLLKMKYKNLNTLPSFDKNKDVFPLPSLKERNKRPWPPCSKVSDYLQVLNLPVTNAARYFAKIIKTATSGNALAGMEIHAGVECFPTNGTVFLSQLLDSPDIDFLGGPSSYNGREPGRSPLHRCALASLEKHNKLWFNEGDYRTHNAYGMRSGKAGQPPIDPQATTEVFRREFARSMIKNYHTYLMDFNWKWFYDRDVIQEIGREDRIGEFMLSTEMKRNCEIAVVSDQESQLYANWFANPNHMRRRTLEQIGCDYKFYELRDFLKGDTYKKYKLVIFLNIRALSDPERREIAKIKSDNRIVLWMHDPGIVNLTRKNVDLDKDLLELTGIKLKYGVKPKGKITIINKNYHSAIITGAQSKKARSSLWDSFVGLFSSTKEPEYVFNTVKHKIRTTELMKEVSLSDTAVGIQMGNLIAPIACVDSAATVLGSDKTGECRFAIRKFDNWTSFYAASCIIAPRIVRDMAKLAGCHIYLDTNDITLANNNFLSIHASEDGVKSIKLPRVTDVYDVFAGKIIATAVNKLSIPMKWGDTRLFYLGNPEKAIRMLSELKQKQIAERKKFILKNPSPKVAYGNYNWARSLPVEKYHALRKKWIKAPANPEGPYSLNAYCPYTFLVSGPYATTNKAKSMMAKFAISAGSDPMKFDWSSNTEKSQKNNHQRRSSDKYLYLNKPEPSRSLSDGFDRWRSLCCNPPWFNDYEFNIGENQTGLIAFFLEGEIGKKTEMLFHAKGDAEIWINGKKPEGEKGVAGIIITLTKKRNLIMIRLSNTGISAGFTCKFIKPGQKLKKGQQARKGSKGISVWLKPLKTTKKTIKKDILK